MIITNVYCAFLTNHKCWILQNEGIRYLFQFFETFLSNNSHHTATIINPRMLLKKITVFVKSV